MAGTLVRRQETSLGRYLKEIRKLPLISSEQEVDLAKRIKNGDKKAHKKLVEANLRFVVSVAKQFKNFRVPLEDLINEGNLGLIKAAEEFDGTIGVKFISYAVSWVMQKILAALVEQGNAVRLPLNRIRDINKIEKTRALMQQELGRDVSIRELDEWMDINNVDKILALADNSKTLYLTNSSSQYKGADLLDCIANGDESVIDALMEKSLNNKVRQVMAELEPLEAQVLKLYFGIGHDKSYSLDEISKILNLPDYFVVLEIKQRALNRLRFPKRAKRLKEVYYN